MAEALERAGEKTVLRNSDKVARVEAGRVEIAGERVINVGVHQDEERQIRVVVEQLIGLPVDRERAALA